MICYGDLTRHGVLTLVPPTLRDISPDTTILRVVFKRYADDCRLVVLSDRNRFGCIADPLDISMPTISTIVISNPVS